MDELAKQHGISLGCGQIVAQPISTRLRQERDRLAARLVDVDKALAYLDDDPTLTKVLDAISQLGFIC